MYNHISYYMIECACTLHCRSTSSEQLSEIESSSAMDTSEAAMVENSSDVELSEDTTADDGSNIVP